MKNGKSHTQFLERQALCLSSYKNHKSKVKLWWAGACKRKKRAFFVSFMLSEGIFLSYLCFISMYSVLNTLSEYAYFYISKNISYNFLLVFKIVESLQCILKHRKLDKHKLVSKSCSVQWCVSGKWYTKVWEVCWWCW